MSCSEVVVQKKMKNLSVSFELAGGQDYFRLNEYRCISFSLTVTILDRLEKPVLLVAIFHFSQVPTLKAGSSIACHVFEDLDDLDRKA